MVSRFKDISKIYSNHDTFCIEYGTKMIYKLIFFIFLTWIVLLLVQNKKLGIDLALFIIILILIVLAISFSPYLVNLLAKIFDIGTPSMAVVALIVAGLVSVVIILLTIVTDLKRKYVFLMRKLAQLELSTIKDKQ